MADYDDIIRASHERISEEEMRLQSLVRDFEEHRARIVHELERARGLAQHAVQLLRGEAHTVVLRRTGRLPGKLRRPVAEGWLLRDPLKPLSGEPFGDSEFWNGRVGDGLAPDGRIFTFFVPTYAPDRRPLALEIHGENWIRWFDPVDLLNKTRTALSRPLPTDPSQRDQYLQDLSAAKRFLFEIGGDSPPTVERMTKPPVYTTQDVLGEMVARRQTGSAG